MTNFLITSLQVRFPLCFLCIPQNVKLLISLPNLIRISISSGQMSFCTLWSPPDNKMNQDIPGLQIPPCGPDLLHTQLVFVSANCPNIHSEIQVPLPTVPLFGTNTPSHSQVIDIHVRQALKSILTTINISNTGQGFHTFKHSGATLTFDRSIPLETSCPKAFGTVWMCRPSHSDSIITPTFASIIPFLP